MSYLLQFTYDVDHTYDHITYIVLNHGEYSAFIEYGGKEKKFEHTVCSGHGNDSSDADCSYVDEFVIDHIIPGLDNFLNNDELHERVIQWIEEKSKIEQHSPDLSILSFMFGCEDDECVSNCNTPDEKLGSRKEIILTKEQLDKFESLGGKYHFFLVPETGYCSNGHSLKMFWCEGHVISGTGDVEIDPNLSEMVIAWLNDDNQSHQITFELNNNVCSHENCDSPVCNKIICQSILLSREQCISFFARKNLDFKFPYFGPVCPKHKDKLYWTFVEDAFYTHSIDEKLADQVLLWLKNK